MLPQVLECIDGACRRAGRDPSEVTLVAVTKGRSLAEIQRHVLDHGHRVLGENRVQEWREKAARLADVRWHFIGNLQRNKVKYLADIVLIHSLNSVRLADTLQLQGQRRGEPFRVLVEVNVAGEGSKQGVDPERCKELVDYARQLSMVEVVGLMTMAPFSSDPETSRPHFRTLRALRNRLGLKELSMGMSGDFEVAIEEGATLVRIGSALFPPGARQNA